MVELTLLCVSASADAVSDRLVDDLDALSASVEDADAGTDAERALFGEPGLPASGGSWQRSLVKALFVDAERARAAASRLQEADGDAVRVQAVEPVANQDWVTLTQAQFAPTEIVPGFWIVPSWRQPAADATHVIRLDPGMAFGTGTHPTTRMCLRWIALRAPRGGARWSRVLDYGCGSGILGIGAALYGATAVDAVDIDPLAIEATQANAAANDVVVQTGPPDAARGRYTLVLANILATPLKLLAPLLCSHLDNAGELVLSGLLQRQAVDIAGTYAPWVELNVADSEDGWVLMTGSLRPPRVASSAR